MFEAFVANKYKSTGVIQWMYNSAWPKLWWQLYDYYLMPNGAFYGARKACAPLHILYNYGTREVLAVNNTLEAGERPQGLHPGLSTSGSRRSTPRKSRSSGWPPTRSEALDVLPEVPGLDAARFVDLRLTTKDNVLVTRTSTSCPRKPRSWTRPTRSGT